MVHTLLSHLPILFTSEGQSFFPHPISVINRDNADLVCYLDDAPDMHFRDHLCSVEEHQQRVQGKGDILQGWVVLKGLRCIHTHRNDTDYGTGPQERMNPLRTKNTICFREWNILMVSVLHIFLTEQVHSQLSLLYLIYPLKNEYAYLKCGHICTFMVHFTTF